MSTAGEIRLRCRTEAARRGESPRDVDLLLAGALGWSVAQLIARDHLPVDAAVLAEFEAALARRRKGEPLQYVRGHADFFGRDFIVDDRALIPRPETEFVIGEVLRRAPQNSRVVDAGTGCGCISVTLALERSDLEILATDISVAALALARTNAQRLGANVRFVASDLLSAIRSPVDVVVSNPPYIGEAELPFLAVEVRDHEPRVALSPGLDALATIRRLYAEAAAILRPGGLLIMEIGYGQAEEVRRLAKTAGWKVEEVVNDLAAIPRVVVSSIGRG